MHFNFILSGYNSVHEEGGLGFGANLRFLSKLRTMSLEIGRGNKIKDIGA